MCGILIVNSWLKVCFHKKVCNHKIKKQTRNAFNVVNTTKKTTLVTAVASTWEQTDNFYFNTL